MDELNLDIIKEVPCTIGGITYKIMEQSRPQLERILRYVNSEVTAETSEKVGKNKKEPTLTDLLFQNWEQSLPAIALILGYEDLDTPSGKEMIAHLNKHLRPSGAIKLFDKWFEINQISDFFDRGGRMTIWPELVQTIRQSKQKLAEEAN